jgi:hypothetical protein
MKGALGFIGAFFVLALVIAWWKVIVGAIILAGVIWAGTVLAAKGIEKRRGRLNAERGERAKIAARAQAQHEQYLTGDARGIYGRYTPANLD